MRRHHSLHLISAVIVTVLLSGCTKREAPAQPQRPPVPQVLRVGVILPLTGDSAYIGQSIQQGMEIERAQAAQAGKPKLEVEYLDTAGDPARVVTAYRSLVDVRKASAIIAVQQGIKALVPLAASDQRVLLATSVPDNGIIGQNPWVFRFFINARSDASTIAAYSREKLGLRTASVLYVNDSMGLSYRDSFRAEFEKRGGKVVQELTFNPGETNFRTVVAKIRGQKPDAVYLVGYGASMANAAIQLREGRVKSTLLAVGTLSQPEILKAAGSAAEGAYYTTAEFFTFDPKTEELREFVRLFQQKYGHVPVFFEVFGYDSLRLLAEAAKRGGVQPQELRDTLRGVRNLPMAAGNVSVQPDGDVQFPVVVKRIVNGQWAPAP